MGATFRRSMQPERMTALASFSPRADGLPTASFGIPVRPAEVREGCNWVAGDDLSLYALGMLRQSIDLELAAASKAAASVGLGTVTPELLHLGNHTSARVAPWPIVARIASGPSFDYSDGSIARELSIGNHLAARRAPSVRPADIEDAGPHVVDGCVVTFWTLVEGARVTTERDKRMAAAALRALHDALADVSGDLPSFMEKITSCESMLAHADVAPRLAAADRFFLQNVYERVSNDLKGIGGTCRPIHGDSHVGNAFMTSDGPIWMDLESVCVGPIEWDIGFLPSATWSEFNDADTTLIRTLADARSLCVATWCWAEFDRSPATQEAARYHLAKLKRRFRLI